MWTGIISSWTRATVVPTQRDIPTSPFTKPVLFTYPSFTLMPAVHIPPTPYPPNVLFPRWFFLFWVCYWKKKKSYLLPLTVAIDTPVGVYSWVVFFCVSFFLFYCHCLFSSFCSHTLFFLLRSTLPRLSLPPRFGFSPLPPYNVPDCHELYIQLLAAQ